MDCSFDDWTSEQAFRLFSEWFTDKRPLWVSCKSPGTSLAANARVLAIAETEVTLSFGFDNAVSGSLTIPLNKMRSRYFANASDAPFQPTANDAEMKTCIEMKFPQFPAEVLICELKR